METFERKAYEKLTSWKDSSQGSTALPIEGARRVGKSTIAEEFERRNYASYMLVDFSKAPDDVLGYFVDLRSDRDDPSNRMEIDFLIVEPYENAAMKYRVSPIEVKSSKHYRTVSLDKFKTKFDKKVGTRYVLHPKPLVVENDVVKLPIYMAGLLQKASRRQRFLVHYQRMTPNTCAHMLPTLSIRSVCRLLPITQLTFQLPFRHPLDTRSSTAEH